MKSMLIRIDPGSDRALFAQIADSIRQQIAEGAARAGTRLPNSRDLAEQLGVNLHTVLKAYRQLCDEGLVEMRRGRGAVVTRRAESLELLTEAAEDLLRRSEDLGLEVEAVVALLRTQARRRS